MEKLKNILKPGHRDDDEVMYATKSRGKSSPHASPSKRSASRSQTLPSNGPADTSSAQPPSQTSTAGVAPTTERAAPPVQSQQGTSSTASATHASTTASSDLKPALPDDTASYASVKSGVIGHPPADPEAEMDTNPPGESPYADYAQYARYIDQPDPADQHGHYGNDAAIAGGAAAMGAKAYEARRREGASATSSQHVASQPPIQEPHKGVAKVGSTSTARKFNLGGSTHPEDTESAVNWPDPSSQTKDRDLAPTAAADAAVVGAPENTKREARPDSGFVETSPSQPNPSAIAAAREATSCQPDATSSSAQEHHYGRDAAMAGVGATVAAGAYEHEHGRDGNAQDTGPAARTIGPHKSDTLNILDPRVKPDPQLMKSGRAGPTETDPSPRTTGPSKSDDPNALDVGAQPQSEKVKGDSGDKAATAAAAAAAVAAGAHAAGSRDNNKPVKSTVPDLPPQKQELKAARSAPPPLAKNYSTESYPDHGPLSDVRPEGSHGGWRNPYSNEQLDPRVDMPGAFPETPAEERSDPQAAATGASMPIVEEQPYKESEHHYGRDTAVAGAVGAAGLGTYEAAKHHEKPSEPASTSDQSASRLGSVNKPEPQQDLYGRDAGLAAGTGVATAGEYAAANERGQSSLPTYAQEMLPGHRAQAEQQQPAVASSTTGIQHDSTTASQEPGHLGRDAALVGGAAAAGAGAYGAGRHYAQDEHAAPAVTQTDIYPQELKEPHHHQPTTAATAGGLLPDSDTGELGQKQSDHHYGRDAALAGGAGAVGAGAYEAYKHHEQQEPAHVQSIRDVYPEDVSQPHHHQPTSAATAGGKQSDSDTGHVQSGEPQRHLGRDAGAVGISSVVGGGTVLASEHRSQEPPARIKSVKEIYGEDVTQPHHHQPTSAATAGGKSPDDETGDNFAGQPQHHYGRDAALAGGAAAAGTGAYEAYKHHEQSQQPPVSPTRALYPPELTEPHHHSPTTAATAGGLHPDSTTGDPVPPAGYRSQIREHLDSSHSDVALAGAGAATAAGAGAASGTASHDYADQIRPTAAQRDPVEAIAAAHTRGYDDQRAGHHAGGAEFDPVRGGVLDHGVSNPHRHARPEYLSQQESAEHLEGHRYGRNAAAVGAAGALGGATYGEHKHQIPESLPKASHASSPQSEERDIGQTPSRQESEESGSPASERKRKHKILTFLNKDKDKDKDSHGHHHERDSTTPSSSLHEQQLVNDPAAEHRQEKEDREKLINPAGGVDSAELQEFGNHGHGRDGLDESMGSVGKTSAEYEAIGGTSSGVLGQVGGGGDTPEKHGSLRSKAGTQRNRLHKEPRQGHSPSH